MTCARAAYSTAASGSNARGRRSRTTIPLPTLCATCAHGARPNGDNSSSSCFVFCTYEEYHKNKWVTSFKLRLSEANQQPNERLGLLDVGHAVDEHVVGGDHLEVESLGELREP